MAEHESAFDQTPDDLLHNLKKCMFSLCSLNISCTLNTHKLEKPNFSKPNLNGDWTGGLMKCRAEKLKLGRGTKLDELVKTNVF